MLNIFFKVDFFLFSLYGLVELVKFKFLMLCVKNMLLPITSNSQFIKESIEKEQRQTESKHSWSFLTEMFQNATGLFIFIPHQIHRAFYFNLRGDREKATEARRQGVFMRSYCNRTY